MEALVKDGHLVDGILALTLAEGCVLAVYHRWTGRGVAPRDVAAYLLSGMLLLVALREALVDASWVWIAAALLGALTAHLIDLRRRWGRGRNPASPDPR